MVQLHDLCNNTKFNFSTSTSVPVLEHLSIDREVRAIPLARYGPNPSLIHVLVLFKSKRMLPARNDARVP
jgi:hypothetical protein